MRLKQFINENKRSRSITKKKALNLIHTKCKDSLYLFKKTGLVIYRGVNSSSDDFYTISPSKFTRVSANTENYYTLINDNSPAWRDYPKRSKSVVCTTDHIMAYKYGTVYAVFPFDNAKIGVCSNEDYWSSFPFLASVIGIDLMLSFNDELRNTFNVSIVRKYTGTIDNIKTYSELREKFKKLDEFIKIYDSGTITDIYPDYEYDKDYKNFIDLLRNQYSIDLFSKYYDFNDTEEYLRYFLDPKLNKFKLKKVGSELPSDAEVWTDSDCVMIKMEILKNILL